MKLSYSILYKELSPDEVNAFINFINSYSMEEVEIDLYINSNGGHYSSCTILNNIISNSNNINLIAVENISSSAFYLFYMANCNKTLMPYTNAIVHTVSLPFDDRDLRRQDDSVRGEQKNLNELNNSLIEMLESNSAFDKKYIKRLKKGEDVFLEYSELLKIMKKCPFGKILLDK